MSTSTVEALVSTALTTTWSYVSGMLTLILPFAIGIAVLFGAIYFVLRRVHVIR